MYMTISDETHSLIHLLSEMQKIANKVKNPELLALLDKIGNIVEVMVRNETENS